MVSLVFTDINKIGLDLDLNKVKYFGLRFSFKSKSDDTNFKCFSKVLKNVEL